MEEELKIKLIELLNELNINYLNYCDECIYLLQVNIPQKILLSDFCESNCLIFNEGLKYSVDEMDRFGRYTGKPNYTYQHSTYYICER